MPFAVILLLLLFPVFPSSAQQQSLTIASLSFTQDNHLVINYLHSGLGGRPFEVRLHRIDPETGAVSFPEIINEDYNNQPLIINDSGVAELTIFQGGDSYPLLLRIVAPGPPLVSSRYHSPFFLPEDALEVIDDMALELRWKKYRILQDLETTFPLPPVPVPHENISVSFYAYSTVSGECDDDIGEFRFMLNVENAIDLAHDFQQLVFTLPPESLEEGKYCYRLWAETEQNRPDKIIHSNTAGPFDIPTLIGPEKPEIQYVSIIDNSLAEVVISQLSNTFFYQLERSAQQGGSWQSTGEEKLFNGTGDTLIFTDPLPHTNQHPWFYRVVVYPGGTDGNVDTSSYLEYSSAQSSLFILAEVEEFDPQTLILRLRINWEMHPFIEEIEEEELEYGIEYHDGNQWREHFGQVAGENTITTDLSGLYQPDIPVRIRMFAAPAHPESPLGPLRIFSNENSPELRSTVDTPNAIRPLSSLPDNREFRPNISGISPSDYSLKIFNRWGNLVWHTTNPSDAWNGRCPRTNDFLPPGLYQYILEFTTQPGLPTTRKTGSLMLVP